MHKITYLLFKGPIPEGKQLYHTCRIRQCINIDHLELEDSRPERPRAQRGPRERRAPSVPYPPERKMDFWEFVNERHAIYLKRLAGEPPPWTTSRALQENYFTNVFRELDRTTIWYNDHIRTMLENQQEILMATVIFRWFNFIDTGEILIRKNLLVNWSGRHAVAALKDQEKYVTGAYMIKTPTGMDKLAGVCWAIDRMWPFRDEMFELMNGKTLEQAWNVLLPYPFMGPFMAYEVITDLRHTFMLDKAPDIMTWANIGPGAKRGLEDIAKSGGSPAPLGLEYMKFLLSQSTDTRIWHYPEWPMEMRDIEHSLCEYSKYCHACEGKHLKRRYDGTGSQERERGIPAGDAAYK